MYNEKIEALIKAALADGVLTEKEKQILFKRAQEQGIDLDEFEMVLDARLVELDKAEKEKAQKSAPKSDKFGDVRKCPACGALVPALAPVCAECGYEISGLDANLSSAKLANKLEEIQESYNKRLNAAGGFDIESKDRKWEMEKQAKVALSQAIKTFPIPIAKADIFEFVVAMQAQMISESVSRLEGEAYMTKYKETMIKIKSLYANDPQFANFISAYENVLKEYRKVHIKQKGFGFKPSTKFWFWFVFGFIVVPAGIIVIAGLYYGFL